MSAVQRILEAGFHLETDGERLVVKPASRLTEEQRTFIRAHKAEIVAELRGRMAANEGAPAGASGDARPQASGREPWSEEDLAEAREERAAIHQHEGGLPASEADRLAELFAAFYGHLMGPGVEQNCCHGRSGRYCPEGRRLRDEYHEACRRAGRLS